jgi:hypothetical protein
MIALLLGWTKLPQWAMELVFSAVLVAVVAGGIMYWHHEVLKEGIAEQVAADNKASQIVIEQAKAETAALQKKADTAESDHAKEIADLTAQLNSAVAQPVRLCLNAHPSGGGLPQAGAANPQHASASAPLSAVQQMPEGNTSGGVGVAGPDIGPMLRLLAFQADSVSAELREFQSR